jgi:hypothetical protein
MSKRVKRGDQRDHPCISRSRGILFNVGNVFLIHIKTALSLTDSQVVFAVHDADNYTRYIGKGVDLSELYHDVVSALRMDTKWAKDTLEFWNK